MDPNENLREQLRLADEIRDLAGSEVGTVENGQSINERLADKAEALAELVDALDNWIRGGGFLPNQWINNK